MSNFIKITQVPPQSTDRQPQTVHLHNVSPYVVSSDWCDGTNDVQSVSQRTEGDLDALTFVRDAGVAKETKINGSIRFQLPVYS